MSTEMKETRLVIAKTFYAVGCFAATFGSDVDQNGGRCCEKCPIISEAIPVMPVLSA